MKRKNCVIRSTKAERKQVTEARAKGNAMPRLESVIGLLAGKFGQYTQATIPVIDARNNKEPRNILTSFLKVSYFFMARSLLLSNNGFSVRVAEPQ